LEEQIANYRARAHEYDEAVPPEPVPGLHLLQEMGPFEQVLELACGTGFWTQALLSIGQEITAGELDTARNRMSAYLIGVIARRGG
jgi:predicted TPR repeat methyltransferase